MTDILRIKRRVSGSLGGPTSLANAELAYNEVDHTLWYGEGTGGGGGSASVIQLIGGPGMVASALPVMDGTASAGTQGPTARWSSSDHVHPSDTSRFATSGGTITGAVTISSGNLTLSSGSINVNAGGASLTGTLNMGNNSIINVAAPILGTDGANKNYVDNAIQGLDAKAPTLVATTGANITLSGVQTIDGVALVAGNRVLVKDQTTTANNGIYVVAAGAWTRSTDMDVWAEVPAAFVFVEQGTANADTGWLCSSDPGGTLGTTPITWVQFSAAGQITAGNGLNKVGNVLNVVGTANRITVGASVDIAANYAGQTSINTLGTVTAGTWNATPVGVAYGGTGATTLTGYLVGNGTGAFTAVASIPNTGISGLGTMSVQNANAVAITGGSIDGITFDGGTF